MHLNGLNRSSSNNIFCLSHLQHQHNMIQLVEILGNLKPSDVKGLRLEETYLEWLLMMSLDFWEIIYFLFWSDFSYLSLLASHLSTSCCYTPVIIWVLHAVWLQSGCGKLSSRGKTEIESGKWNYFSPKQAEQCRGAMDWHCSWVIIPNVSHHWLCWVGWQSYSSETI